MIIDSLSFGRESFEQQVCRRFFDLKCDAGDRVAHKVFVICGSREGPFSNVSGTSAKTTS